ncbi:hypothetical protein CCACVL1_15880 [Corchorus capsularis]|uniref:F-box domain-containing protein n=1 Tax=Corchorus capsularis TaxID=210143 RepID=A0A1R3I0Q8_COCAP|nr:hypothetical protein CCACVL1_15880 [Corchorus capsularis]
MEPIAPLLHPNLSDDVAMDNRNRFNNMPEHLIHHIFKFMGTKEMLKASAVATNWRFLWTQMPYLRFYFDPNLKSDYKLMKDAYGRYKDMINWVLMTHDKSVSIQSFLLQCKHDDYDHSIYRWMNILAQKHVRDLNLEAAIIFGSWYYELDDVVVVLPEEFADHMLKILRGVRHAEVLKLHKWILEYIYPAVAKPEFFTTFYNLKALLLPINMRKCHVQPLIYLMKCAPNLHRLYLRLEPFACFVDYISEIPDEAIECLSCHLKKVKLFDMDCYNLDELELIRFFLKNGHVLEDMSIIWYGDGRQKSQRKPAIQKVMRFPRSSSYVTVTFSEAKQSGWDDELVVRT